MELLQQVRIVDPVGKIDRLGDVWLEGGEIKLIDDRLTDYPADATIIPPSDLILGTGLVDLYSHSGEPGNETRETLAALAQAAARGGFTQVGILPDTFPALDSAETIAALKQKANLLSGDSPLATSWSHLNLWGAAGHLATQKMNPLGELEAQTVGFTGSYDLSGLSLLKQVLEYVQPWQKPVAIALHQNELTGKGVVREGEVSIRYGMTGNPSYSEAAIIAAVLEIAAEMPSMLHIMRVSTRRGVELIAEAKARGVNVTASTTWMHLLWHSEAVSSFSSNLRLEPPLGSELDRLALAEGVRQGIIDAIAIDHQAYTYEEKTVAFALAPPGVVGLELALPLLWQRFVATGAWTALELWQALSHRPRQCLLQQPQAIAAGNSADLVLFAPQEKWLANRDNLKSPGVNTPWYNQEITGRVVRTWTGSVGI
ncbi:MAG: dihydroorotase [Cyanobacteria bacterium J06629_2]